MADQNDHQPDEVMTADDLAAQALGEATDDDSTTTTPDDTAAEVAESDNLANTVMSLQNLIERHANRLDELKETVKQLRQQLKDHFDSDAQLSEAKVQADEYTSQVKERKAKLQADPSVTNLKVKIAEQIEEQKEVEEALSDHLVNYYSLTNSKSFDTSDGDQREFVIKAKVSGKRPSKD